MLAAWYWCGRQLVIGRLDSSLSRTLRGAGFDLSLLARLGPAAEKPSGLMREPWLMNSFGFSTIQH